MIIGKSSADIDVLRTESFVEMTAAKSRYVKWATTSTIRIADMLQHSFWPQLYYGDDEVIRFCRV